jgi:ribosomal protein S18 acetylase RimI-like enzyme
MTSATPSLTGISLRPATDSDEAFLEQLFVSARPELLLINLPEIQKAALIRMQFNAQHEQYAAAYPRAEHRIILQRETQVGRMMTNHSEREIVLIDIALLPETRGAGIGSSLLQELLAAAKRAGKKVRLQVLKTNPAFRLYERLGFRITGDESMYWEMVCDPASLDDAA